MVNLEMDERAPDLPAESEPTAPPQTPPQTSKCGRAAGIVRDIVMFLMLVGTLMLLGLGMHFYLVHLPEQPVDRIVLLVILGLLGVALIALHWAIFLTGLSRRLKATTEAASTPLIPIAAPLLLIAAPLFLIVAPLLLIGAPPL